MMCRYLGTEAPLPSRRKRQSSRRGEGEEQSTIAETVESEAGATMQHTPQELDVRGPRHEALNAYLAKIASRDELREAVVAARELSGVLRAKTRDSEASTLERLMSYLEKAHVAELELIGLHRSMYELEAAAKGEEACATRFAEREAAISGFVEQVGVRAH